MFCFTKAFGLVFLGTPRHHFHDTPKEAGIGKLIPMYAVVLVITSIGLFPKVFITALSKPVALFIHNAGNEFSSVNIPAGEALSMIGLCAAVFLLVAGLIYFIRKKLIINKPVEFNITWGCGYIGPTEKMQYTASSFIRAYRKLAEPFLSIRKKKKEIKEVFPKRGDRKRILTIKLRNGLLITLCKLLKGFFNRFTFLQNGNLQFYILYGVVFISLVLGVPFLSEYIKSLIGFLNKI